MMPKKSAMKFIVIMGIVSLFSDMTYEAARSITGPYMALLGASATAVGVISGLGEFIGYALRLLTGWLTDKTKKYWTLTFIGYVLNILIIPAFALANRWEYAAALIVMERIGKAIRKPAKDTMTSYAAKEVGAGWGFAVEEALDQLGAVLGPVFVALILMVRRDPKLIDNYKQSFMLLAIPAFITIAILLVARFMYPRPSELETKKSEQTDKNLTKTYWWYMGAIAFIAAGFADFPLMAYHFKTAGVFSDSLIPVVYAIAMGVDALAALVFGRLFDKKGIPVLMISSLIAAMFSPFVFLNFRSNQLILATLGVILWGIGMGAQESILKAAIATMVPSGKRGTAYGIFNTGFGLFWFLGSTLMGVLYDTNIMMLVVFSVIMQLCSIPMLFMVKKEMSR